jgi:hypothetical protein
MVAVKDEAALVLTKLNEIADDLFFVVMSNEDIRASKKKNLQACQPTRRADFLLDGA